MATNRKQPLDVAALLGLSGFTVPGDRAEMLARGLTTTTRGVAAALARQDYGDAEPAVRFRPRPVR